MYVADSMSSLTPLDDNIFKDAMDGSADDSALDRDGESVMETPPSSPASSDTATNRHKQDEKAVPGLFSVAQISLKLNELWSSAREKVFGEDYWIPSDPYEVAYFSQELLAAHTVVYPPGAPTASKGGVENDLKNGESLSSSRPGHVALMVVQGTLKNEPSNALHHVVYNYTLDDREQESLTIFRSKDVGEALDFCRRCEECRALLKLLDKKKDVRKPIRDITSTLQAHPLWRLVHVAICCHRDDMFTDDALNYLKSIGYAEDDIVNTVSSPEGLNPLMMAIECQHTSIVRFLLKIGADPAARDISGNNALHYASLASVQMIETVWECEKAKPLINMMNNDGYTPVLLAIRNANPRCLKTLLSFGAELNLRVSGKNPLFEAVQSKGKSIEVIRALLEASPNLLTTVEEATGNTVLHAALYKMPLMGVLYLKHKDLDLNKKNKAGQTALHLFASRGDIGMLVTLTSYGCDLDVANDSGNTALHLAVSKKYLDVTRLLLAMGADPNPVNEHNDTPRHLAAKLNENELLKALVISGAKRCPLTKQGCVSGCVNERSLQFSSKRSSNGVDTQSQARLSPSKSMSVEDWESRNFGKEYRYNRIEDAEHNQIYDDMLTKLRVMAEKGERNTNLINVLTLDGGGIRGLVIIHLLLAVEKELGEPIFKYFDWVAGTSTGALIAAGLAIGRDLRQLQRIYLRFKDLIFEGYSRPYNSAILERFIQQEMGKTSLVSDIKWPRLMITTTRADTFPVQLDFMRNYRLPLSDDENLEMGFINPSEILLWKALRRSSAAPTYFSSVDSKYIDGGIIANNPTMDMLAEIQLWNSVNTYMKLPNSVRVGCLLSIGTGVIPNIPMDTNLLELTPNPFSSPYANAVAIKNLGVILVDQVTATEGAPVNRSAAWCITRRTPFFRLSAPLHKEVAMDTRDDVELARMMWDCMEYSYRHKDYIEKLCALIKQVGQSWTRRNLFQPTDQLHCDMETQTSRPATPGEEQHSALSE